jgi:hypothetical protein
VAIGKAKFTFGTMRLLRPAHYRCLLGPLVVLAATGAQGQYFRNSNYWKTHRQELSVGIGTTHFLGDLGGRNAIGSPFIWDLDIAGTRPAASFSARYYVREKVSVRGQLAYGIAAGNDNLTKEAARENRNLSFRSDVLEISGQLEFHLFRERYGRLFDLRGTKANQGVASRMGLYAFLGGGGFFYNPKAQYNNNWVALRPLGTEGQGLPGGADDYSSFSPCVLFGAGVRKPIQKTWSIGAELQYVKTFTDYLDDVSGVYYDRNALLAARGPQAAFLADPSLGAFAGQTDIGAQRGDPSDLDSYFFLRFHAHYKIFRYRGNSQKYRSRLHREKIVF